MKEALPDQIEQFQPTYWASDELYLDEELSFYKALGGGQVAKKGLLALASKDVRDNNRRSVVKSEWTAARARMYVVQKPCMCT